mmetsp:Transcript_68770/g.157769  ORF Transcript_68770/g.157769 Transcript_68770/m.157769 type:complete len:252 (-) Transcript_68770:167-922(-)
MPTPVPLKEHRHPVLRVIFPHLHTKTTAHVVVDDLVVRLVFPLVVQDVSGGLRHLGSVKHGAPGVEVTLSTAKTAIHRRVLVRCIVVWVQRGHQALPLLPLSELVLHLQCHRAGAFVQFDGCEMLERHVICEQRLVSVVRVVPKFDVPAEHWAKFVDRNASGFVVVVSIHIEYVELRFHRNRFLLPEIVCLFVLVQIDNFFPESSHLTWWPTNFPVITFLQVAREQRHNRLLKISFPQLVRTADELDGASW